MKSKPFDAVARIGLEQGATSNLSKQILNRIVALENKAAAVRQAGGNPAAELAADIGKLVDQSSLAHLDVGARYDEALDDIRGEYETEKGKRPMETLARLEEAKLKIGMLTDQELQLKAGAYLNDPKPLDEYEARLMVGRLKDVAPAMTAGFMEILGENNVLDPWKNDPQATKLLQEAETVKHTKPGYVNFVIDGALQQAPIDTLVDLHGELDRV